MNNNRNTCEKVMIKDNLGNLDNLCDVDDEIENKLKYIN